MRFGLESGNHKANNEGFMMMAHSIWTSRRLASIVWAVVFLAAPMSAHATTHIIQFGGAFGFAYSPSSLTVSVGDTIVWNGDFSVHPLSSTRVPPGAASFQNSSGSTFTYHVTIAGTYDYQCDLHFGIGMVGSFTALITTNVEKTQTSLQPDALRLEQNYPNPFNPSTTIRYVMPKGAQLVLEVYNTLGEKVATLVDGWNEAGEHQVRWTPQVASGVYVYRLRAGSFVESKRLLLLR
jgi:plastocyanin